MDRCTHYEQVLIPRVSKALAAGGKIRLYYELGPAFSGIDAGAVWEDLKIGVEHLSRWERVAVVTDVRWIQHTLEAFRFLMPGRLRIFDTNRTDEARAWIKSNGLHELPRAAAARSEGAGKRGGPARQSGARRCKPLQVVAGACFEATKSHLVCFSLGRVSQPMAIPDICGNGHLLTPDNLKVDQAKRRWRCRRCGRARAAGFRARQKPAA